MAPRTRSARTKLLVEAARAQKNKTSQVIVLYQSIPEPPPFYSLVSDSDDSNTQPSSQQKSQFSSHAEDSKSVPDLDSETQGKSGSSDDAVSEDNNLDSSSSPSEFKKRYDQNRLLQDKLRAAYPQMNHPSSPPFSHHFVSEAAYQRFGLIHQRKFLDQKVLPTQCQQLVEVERIIVAAGLINTVKDVQPYVKEIVYEFYANLPDLVVRNNRPMVFIRGRMFECSSEMINKLFALRLYSGLKATAHGDIDDTVKIATAGKITRWEDMSPTAFSSVWYALHLFCCFNWMPSRNRSKVCKERLLFIQMLVDDVPFDFGLMVLDHIKLVASSPEKRSSRLLFPNLIYQLLNFQYDMTTLIQESDHFSEPPLPLPTQRVKASVSPHILRSTKRSAPSASGSRSAAAPSTARSSQKSLYHLKKDLKQASRMIRTIQARVDHGEYGCFCSKSQDPCTSSSEEDY